MALPSEGEPQAEGEPQESSARLEVLEVLKGPPHGEESGEGLLFRTNRGDLRAILHRAEGSSQGVIWVYGARGGFGGPGPGTYARLAEELLEQDITSMRLDYRQPNDLDECAADIFTGIAFFRAMEHEPVVLVGHSFGGAVVIAAGAASSHVKGVVSLSPQTYGAGRVSQLSPKPILLVHGKADTRLPYDCAQQIYNAALEPKTLVLYDGAEHRLEECRDELEQLLTEWIPETLAAQDARI